MLVVPYVLIPLTASVVHSLLHGNWLHLPGSSCWSVLLTFTLVCQTQSSILVKSECCQSTPAFSLAILPCYLMSILGNTLKWENRSVAGKASLFCSTKMTSLHSDSIIFQSLLADLCALNRNVSFPPLPLQTELIDLSTVDVILISNYHCMMALPYITEHTGFTGTVYATEPTVQIGRWEPLFLPQEKVAEALLSSLGTV